MAPIPIPRARPRNLDLTAPSVAPAAPSMGGIPIPRARPGAGAMGAAPPPLPIPKPPKVDFADAAQKVSGTPEERMNFRAAAEAIAAYEETGDPLSAAAIGFIRARAAKDAQADAAADKAYERSVKEEERAYSRDQDARTWDYRARRDAAEDDQWAKGYDLQKRQEDRAQAGQDRDFRTQDYQDLKIAQEIETLAARALRAGVDPDTLNEITKAYRDEKMELREDYDAGLIDEEEMANRAADIEGRYDRLLNRNRSSVPTEDETDAPPMDEGEGAPPVDAAPSRLSQMFMLPNFAGAMPTGRVPMGGSPMGIPPAAPPPMPAAPMSQGYSGDGTRENPFTGLPADPVQARQLVASMPSGAVFVVNGRMMVKK